MRKADIDKAPYLYANTPKFELLESGPAKAAIKVSRQLGVSKVEQVISLMPAAAVFGWRTLWIGAAADLCSRLNFPLLPPQTARTTTWDWV